MDWNCSANVAAFVSFSAAKDTRSPLMTNPRSTLAYLTQRLIRAGWMISLPRQGGARIFPSEFSDLNRYSEIIPNGLKNWKLTVIDKPRRAPAPLVRIVVL